MFQYKTKKREVILTNSVVISLEMSRRILKFMFQRKRFHLHHAIVRFRKPENPLQPWTKKKREEVEVSVIVNNTHFNFSFPIQSDGCGWEVVPFSDMKVEATELKEEFWLSCGKDQSISWNSCDITFQEVYKILPEIE